MKRFILAVCLFLLGLAPTVSMAASSMAVSVDSIAQNGNIMVVKILCTADADGTFTPKQITTAEISKTTLGLRAEYYQLGYYLAHAWVVNSATNDHTNAAVVTIYDGSGQVIIGAQSGDTLSLSQAAYSVTTHAGIAYLSASRSAAQRAVTSALTIEIADTGSTATVQTLYLLLVR